jgi:hypothetical protein
MAQTATQEKSGKTYDLTVDGKKLSSAQPVLSGSDIKLLAAVPGDYGLFLEGHGKNPDQQIADSQTVDLREPGKESFYTAPPATFGLRRVRST